MSVGVMKDYKLKQRNLRASHTLAIIIFLKMELFASSLKVECVAREKETEGETRRHWEPEQRLPSWGRELAR